MVSNYIEDTSNEDTDDNNKLEKHPTEVPKDYNNIERPTEEPTKETIEEAEEPIEEPIEESKEPIEESKESAKETIEEVEEPAVEPIKATPKSKFLNL